MAAKIKDGRQNRGNLLVLFIKKKLYQKHDILCTEESVTQILLHYCHLKTQNGRQNPRWTPRVDKIGLGSKMD